MTADVDILIIGGGIAGLSLASRLARHAAVAVIERETGLGYHASGRSATMVHQGIGTDLVRALTHVSSGFFADPPEDMRDVPLSTPRAAMFVARAGELDQLETLEAAMRRRSDRIEHLGPGAVAAIVPVIRVDEAHVVAAAIDHGARKLDSDALLRAHARRVRAAGGRLALDQEVVAIARQNGRWTVRTREASWSAPILVNAAGAWADDIARTAGVVPLGLQPLRRTIIAFDPPDHLAVDAWPFVKTVVDDGFYMLPDAGRLLASPMDATLSDPLDARPEEEHIALAAWRVEESTTLAVRRIAARWAGLRSFLRDGGPAAGFDGEAPGFFWLAGQGGFGLQTSPAMAMAAAALVVGGAWPEELLAAGVTPERLAPTRHSIGRR